MESIISNQLNFGVLIAGRIGPLCALPFFFPRGTGLGFRWIIFAALTLYFTAIIPQPADFTFSIGAFISEIFLGMITYFLINMLFYIFEYAGAYMEKLRGGQMPVSLLGSTNSTMGAAWGLFAVVIFLTTGAHRLFFNGIAMMFTQIPPGSFVFSEGNIFHFFEIGVKTGEILFATAFLISIPLFATILMVDISMGVLSRFYPSINGYFLAMPLKGLMGIAGILLSIPLLIYAMTTIFSLINDIITTIQ